MKEERPGKWPTVLMIEESPTVLMIEGCTRVRGLAELWAALLAMTLCLDHDRVPIHSLSPFTITTRYMEFIPRLQSPSTCPALSTDSPPPRLLSH